MARKTLTALAFALLLSGNALAQSGSREQSGSWFTQVIQWFQTYRATQHPQSPSPSTSVRAVPELDGSMAVMALGLTLAVGGLIREKRRTR
jgi:hypothetical protein